MPTMLLSKISLNILKFNCALEPIKVELALDHDALKALEGGDNTGSPAHLVYPPPLSASQPYPSSPFRYPPPPPPPPPDKELGTLEALALGAILGGSSGSTGRGNVLENALDSHHSGGTGKFLIKLRLLSINCKYLFL